MSIICAAIKNGEVAIAADTQMSCGPMMVTAEDLKNYEKLYRVNGSVIGLIGWKAMSTMFEDIIEDDSKLFKLDDRKQIYKSMMRLHQLMKNKHFLETSETASQPVESLQLSALIINKNGIYEIGSYRDVCEYTRFWAIGSGQDYSLGAMHALYEKNVSAEALVVSGVIAAARFDKGCSLPVTSEVMPLAVKQQVAKAV